MTIRPGRNLIWIVAAVAVLSPLTFAWPIVVWLMLAALLPISALAFREYRLLASDASLVEISRRLPNLIGRDVVFRSELEIKSTGPNPLNGVLRDVHPAAADPEFLLQPFETPAGHSINVGSELRIDERGRHEFGPVWLRLHGPLGLLELQRSWDCRGEIKVLPETYASTDRLSADKRAELMLLDKAARARQHGVGTDFESLSEFRDGDDPRRIDWRTTARVGRPIVRRYQIEPHRDVIIVIDCGRLMGAATETGSKLDCAVDAGLMLARVALQGGDRCGMGLFDDRVRGYLSPVSGIASIKNLADNVFDLQSQWRESDFAAMFAELQLRQPRRSLIVILSDFVDTESSLRFRTSLARLARRHVVLVAALRTPSLAKIVNSPVESMLDGSRTAVTFRLLRERERAVHSVRRSGVHVVDVEPNELTIPLINQFVELRQMSTL